MTILESIIFGLVEGITEFLPISSTAHLIITAEILKLEQSDFIKTFEVAIQLGAILSIVVLYWRSLLQNKEVLKRIAAAFIPTAIVGFVLYELIKGIFGSLNVVLWALFWGGVAIILFEHFYREKDGAHSEIAEISYKKAVIIGLFQSIAVIPGVSRAAATIIGGLWLGLKRKTIVEFSFLLAVPTMLAATGFDLYKNAPSFSSDEFILLAFGLVASFVFATMAVKLLLKFIQQNDFKFFGAYRIVIAILFFAIFIK
ncbi:MAG: undecaprenyl-diphosphatase UppP [bacterium]|nr:undecaprenyl-diphosphatase UppP [bacterium]